jgi:flagellar motility protein MotE (MotC chaperone)
MTSLVLVFWLAAATGGSTAGAAAPISGTAPAAPQAPKAPAAPAVNGPPLPTVPTLPDPHRAAIPAPGSKSAKKNAETDEASEAVSESAAGKRESGRPAGKSKKSSSAGTQGRGVPNLPTLSTNALKNELRQSLAGPNEPGQVTERARLEQLAAEIAKAREALRQETTRLEDLIRQRGSCDGELRANAIAAANAAASPGADTSAKDAEREQMDSVSKAMKGMKPEQAAAVVTRLDHRLASEILRRMRPADAGAVLGFLRPELAAELATEIATRRSTIPSKKANP